MADQTTPADRASRPVEAHPDQGGRATGRWYYVLTIATFGFFAWVPFLHASRRLRSAAARRLLLISAVLDAVVYVLAALTPQNSQGQVSGTAGNAISTVGGLLALGVTIVACVQLAPLRRQVYEGAPTGDEHPAVDPAVTAVLAARARREEARQLAAADPLLARELHIGRPDVTRAYDDGGLIDLNTADAALIAEGCGIPTEVAESIVATRTLRAEPFANVDELLVIADLPVSTWDRIRDRAVLIA